MKLTDIERKFMRTIDEYELYFGHLKFMYRGNAIDKNDLTTYLTNTYNSLLSQIKDFVTKNNLNSENEVVKLANRVADDIKTYLENLTCKRAKNLRNEHNNNL